MNIKNKTILITGANRGIGRALVDETLSRGAKRVYAGTRQPLIHPDERDSRARDMIIAGLDVGGMIGFASARDFAARINFHGFRRMRVARSVSLGICATQP